MNQKISPKWFYDIRLVQIVIMGSLLGTGVLVFDFSLKWPQALLTFVFGIFCQYLWVGGIKPKSLLSALITCLSLVLLLRSNSFWVHPLIAVLSVSSKFLIQIRGHHFINPSAFGLVFALLFLPDAWVSPGQWGSFFLIAVWITAFGSLITKGVKRVDISWMFLCFYLSGLGLRNIWLGYEWEVSVHSSLSGSLLLFTFFMISDPKTSPDHFISKAILAFFYRTFISNPTLWFLYDKRFYIQPGLSLLFCARSEQNL